MPYLVDGHNLIGQLADISLDDPNDEALLVQKLAGYAAGTGKRFVVVFDGGIPGGGSRLSNRAVEVVFASPRTNADAIIKERIRNLRDPRNWTVVSSDHQVLDAGRQRGMHAVSSAEFARHLAERAKAQVKPAPEKPDDRKQSAEDVETWLKIFGSGNPKQG